MAIGTSRKTVRKYLNEIQVAPAMEVQPLFSWEEIIRENQLNDISVQILWEEFKEVEKNFWSYSYF